MIGIAGLELLAGHIPSIWGHIPSICPVKYLICSADYFKTKYCTSGIFHLNNAISKLSGPHRLGCLLVDNRFGMSSSLPDQKLAKLSPGKVQIFIAYSD